jgi:predicted nucleic acid-binding protein
LIILDSSVAIAWCLTDESSEYAYAVLDRIVSSGAAAPAHWPLEVANAFLSAQRAGRLDEQGLADASRLLGALQIEIAPVELTTALWGVSDAAREHGLTAYDAAYLELARFRGEPLATLDGPLRAAATSAGVPLV